MDAFRELRVNMRMTILRKNNRGIAVIYLAICMIVLIGFVGLAVDIGYMYVAKGQLQNAADAAALAGAAKLLSNSKSTSQSAARNEAVNFADKNKAAGQFLTLSTNDTNNANGDVVLGNWDQSRLVDQRFLPGDGTLFINAVKVVARRAGAGGTGIGANARVGIFFGKIFSLLPGGGTGWRSMATVAQAIALNSPPPQVPLPICFPTCGTATNLNGTTQFYFNAKKGTPNVTWSSFLVSSTNKGDVEDYLTGKTPTPDLCGLLKTNPPVCLFTTQGTVKPDMCTLISQIRQHSQNYTVNGQQIKAWKVLVPIFDDKSNPCGGKTACLGDPGNQPGDAYSFVGYAVVYILDAVAQGNCPDLSPKNLKGEESIIVVGDGPGVSGTSTISCQSCDLLLGTLTNIVKLVK